MGFDWPPANIPSFLDELERKYQDWYQQYPSWRNYYTSAINDIKATSRTWPSLLYIPPNEEQKEYDDKEAEALFEGMRNTGQHIIRPDIGLEALWRNADLARDDIGGDPNVTGIYNIKNNNIRLFGHPEGKTMYPSDYMNHWLHEAQHASDFQKLPYDLRQMISLALYPEYPGSEFNVYIRSPAERRAAGRVIGHRMRQSGIKEPKDLEDVEWYVKNKLPDDEHVDAVLRREWSNKDPIFLDMIRQAMEEGKIKIISDIRVKVPVAPALEQS